MPKKTPQIRKFVKNLPQDLSDSSPDASPEKKRSRPSWLDPTSSEEETEPIFQPPPPTRISENDPLFESRPSISRQKPAVTDEEWQEMMRMTRKEVPAHGFLLDNIIVNVKLEEEELSVTKINLYCKCT